MYRHKKRSNSKRSSKSRNRSRSSSHKRGKRSRGKGRKKKQIHESRFVNRAEPQEEKVEFVPTHTFSDFKVDDRLKENLAKKGFETPTPIQDEVIPHILNGKDVVGIANTGTGKTLAFVLPLLNKVIEHPREKVVVVTPTRELAQQIDQEIRKLTLGMRVFSVVTVGGMPIHRQIKFLKRPHNLVVGTPGRLMDLRERKVIDFSTFQTVVLDEADRMLDMGFIKDIETIMKDIPNDRQTLFFSATMPRGVERFIDRFLTNAERVSVKTHETSKHVDQDVVRINHGQSKLDVLSDLLGKEAFEKVLVFGRTKRGVDRLSRDLSRRGFKTDAIHGDKSQPYRQKALRKFKDDHVDILVATDVAARGLDIPNVSHVINYDAPEVYDDYVHRIGRTGRGGKSGKALTFVH